jgi:ABC-type polysaccharide/polyol phosphate export permease
MGLIVGWRIHSTPYEAVTGFLLLLPFSYAFSWVTATVALALRTPEIFNNIVTVVSMPLVFLSNAFVDSSRLPGPLMVVAEWNPVSTIIKGARELFGNIVPARPAPGAWPLQHAAAASLLWSVGGAGPAVRDRGFRISAHPPQKGLKTHGNGTAGTRLR